MAKRLQHIPYDQVHQPAAVITHQRPHLKPIRYGVWTRFSDAWAGLRDRPLDMDAGSDTVRTAWTTRVLREFANTAEREHLSADAAIHLLAHEHANHGANRDRHLTEIPLDEKQAALHEDKLQGELPVEPANGGELFEDEVTRDARRRHHLRRKAEGHRQAATAKTAAAAEARIAMSVREDAIDAHWNALLVRTFALQAYYERRLATYARWIRRRGQPLFPPHLDLPDWGALSHSPRQLYLPRHDDRVENADATEVAS